MRKTVMVSSLLVSVTLAAGAQAKMSGQLSCGKPDVNSSADVGDVAGHIMTLQKGTCTWSTPFSIAGTKAVSAVDAGMVEVNGATASQHGYSTTTMDSGDKTVSKFTGTLHPNQDGSGTFNGTWRFVSGTGKMKGIKGSGTYKGSAAADGTGTVNVEGHYTVPGSAAKSAKKSSR